MYTPDREINPPSFYMDEPETFTCYCCKDECEIDYSYEVIEIEEEEIQMVCSRCYNKYYRKRK